MLKSKEEVYNIALDMANTLYLNCKKYEMGIKNTNITLIDYDINGDIDFQLIGGKIDTDETLRSGLYEILEDINSLEFQMYSLEDISISMGMYDCVLHILFSRLREDGYSIYIKTEDSDYDLSYYIGEVLIDGVYDLKDDILSAFIIALPYDIVVIKK